MRKTRKQKLQQQRREQRQQRREDGVCACGRPFGHPGVDGAPFCRPPISELVGPLDGSDENTAIGIIKELVSIGVNEQLAIARMDAPDEIKGDLLRAVINHSGVEIQNMKVSAGAADEETQLYLAELVVNLEKRRQALRAKLLHPEQLDHDGGELTPAQQVYAFASRAPAQTAEIRNSARGNTHLLVDYSTLMGLRRCSPTSDAFSELNKRPADFLSVDPNMDPNTIEVDLDQCAAMERMLTIRLHADRIAPPATEEYLRRTILQMLVAIRKRVSTLEALPQRRPRERNIVPHMQSLVDHANSIDFTGFDPTQGIEHIERAAEPRGN